MFYAQSTAKGHITAKQVPQVQILIDNLIRIPPLQEEEKKDEDQEDDDDHAEDK